VKNSNRDKLRKLMDEHDLTRQWVADEIAGGSIFTVNAWLKPEDNKSHRSIPDQKLELLELKLANRQK
jgi:hypothetical protein